jgi:hypothetical protein
VPAANTLALRLVLPSNYTARMPPKRPVNFFSEGSSCPQETPSRTLTRAGPKHAPTQGYGIIKREKKEVAIMQRQSREYPKPRVGRSPSILAAAL